MAAAAGASRHANKLHGHDVAQHNDAALVPWRSANESGTATVQLVQHESRIGVESVHVCGTCTRILGYEYIVHIFIQNQTPGHRSCDMITMTRKRQMTAQ
jgi:hypothetical protein